MCLLWNTTAISRMTLIIHGMRKQLPISCSNPSLGGSWWGARENSPPLHNLKHFLSVHFTHHSGPLELTSSRWNYLETQCLCKANLSFTWLLQLFGFDSAHWIIKREKVNKFWWEDHMGMDKATNCLVKSPWKEVISKRLWEAKEKCFWFLLVSFPSRFSPQRTPKPNKTCLGSISK